MREMQNLMTIIICPYAQFCFGRKHILAKMAELANLHSFTHIIFHRKFSNVSYCWKRFFFLRNRKQIINVNSLFILSVIWMDGPVSLPKRFLELAQGKGRVSLSVLLILLYRSYLHSFIYSVCGQPGSCL